MQICTEFGIKANILLCMQRREDCGPCRHEICTFQSNNGPSHSVRRLRLQNLMSLFLLEFCRPALACAAVYRDGLFTAKTAKISLLMQSKHSLLSKVQHSADCRTDYQGLHLQSWILSFNYS